MSKFAVRVYIHHGSKVQELAASKYIRKKSMDIRGLVSPVLRKEYPQSQHAQEAPFRPIPNGGSLQRFQTEVPLQNEMDGLEFSGLNEIGNDPTAKFNRGVNGPEIRPRFRIAPSPNYPDIYQIIPTFAVYSANGTFQFLQ
jgi:hypothetical protein